MRDRFLLGILVGIGVLVLAALILFFVRDRQPLYMDDSTPEGVVHNYLLAVQQQDFERAYKYLAEISDKPTLAQFRLALLTETGRDLNNISVQIGSAAINSDQSALVQVTLLRGSGDPFGGIYRDQQSANLVQENGLWKIVSAPYPFWSFNWYQGK